MKKNTILAFSCLLFFGLWACSKTETQTDPYTAVKAVFGTKINLDKLDNYAAQTKPSYITQDNTGSNPINDKKATLGRVLFYDKNLSIDNTVSCSSCHKQALAFSDDLQASKGVKGGTTGRHSMRLINARFAQERRFFWDERANTLELQTTQPIKDHAEMGFSGQTDRPTFEALLSKLAAIGYYKELFTFAYGDAQITEQRMQESLSQFIRSIQSFDSKFDAGRAQANNEAQPFPNFTATENQGKQLFLVPPQLAADGTRIGGGAGCAGCHRPPEFDIDPNSRNNGIIGTINAQGADQTVTRSPTLRDLVKTNGTTNGGMMHNGNFDQLIAVINHYNQIPTSAVNPNLDPRLRPNGNPQNLRLTQNEKDALLAFLQTLSGTAVYTDPKWSDPFAK